MLGLVRDHASSSLVKSYARKTENMRRKYATPKTRSATYACPPDGGGCHARRRWLEESRQNPGGREGRRSEYKRPYTTRLYWFRTATVRPGSTGEAPTAGKQARRAAFRRPSVFWGRDKMSRRDDSASPRSWARRRCRPCWCRFRGAGRRRPERPSCSCRVPRSPDARANGAPMVGRERASEPLWMSRGVAAPHTGSERPPPIDENRAKVVNLVPSSTGPEPRAISESPRGPVRRS